MAKGTINVNTEDIFPIIKKFLYSDQDIFLRELVSNAVDATQKIKLLSQKGEATGELGDTYIEVSVDEKKKTITISDRGLGMTKEEVEKYINQIAFSSATEFVEKYKDDSQIIGHFGLGFYSAFMVSKKVEIQTLSFKEDAEPVHWTCIGNTDYNIKKGKRNFRGTDVILHLDEDSQDLLEGGKVNDILKKFCSFLPVEIKFGDETINDTNPIWKRKPSELKDEDYTAFYNKLYPYSQPPLFWIHLNVDFPFNLTGVLYFPKVNNQFEINKNKIQLYCNQVFVTDSVEDIVPEYLTLLHGVIDSPDIPLNVSRSYLQGDPNVKKISSHISKKVVDKLEEIFKNDRKELESKWGDIGVFVKYGMISDEKFYERAEKICLFKDSDDNSFTMEELTKKIEKNQKDKDGNLIVLYSNNLVDQDSYIKNAKENGYTVLCFDQVLDMHFVNQLEMKLEKTQFKRVDADTLENLINKEEDQKSVLNEKQEEKLKGIFHSLVDGKQGVTVELKSMSPEAVPVMITKPEFIRRMNEMSAVSGAGQGFQQEMYNLVVNSNHPISSKILKEKDEEKRKSLSKELYDLALLSQNMLRGEDLTEFVNRSMNKFGS